MLLCLFRDTHACNVPIVVPTHARTQKRPTPFNHGYSTLRGLLTRTTGRGHISASSTGCIAHTMHACELAVSLHACALAIASQEGRKKNNCSALQKEINSLKSSFQFHSHHFCIDQGLVVQLLNVHASYMY